MRLKNQNCHLSSQFLPMPNQYPLSCISQSQTSWCFLHSSRIIYFTSIISLFYNFVCFLFSICQPIFLTGLYAAVLYILCLFALDINWFHSIRIVIPSVFFLYCGVFLFIVVFNYFALILQYSFIFSHILLPDSICCYLIFRPFGILFVCYTANTFVVYYWIWSHLPFVWYFGAI